MKSNSQQQLNNLERRLHNSYRESDQAMSLHQQLQKDRSTLQNENQMYRSKVDELEKLVQHREGQNTDLAKHLDEQRRTIRMMETQLTKLVQQNESYSRLVEDSNNKWYNEALIAGKATAELSVTREDLQTEKLLRRGREEAAPTIKQALEQNRELYERNIQLIGEKTELEQKVYSLEKELREVYNTKHMESLHKLKELHQKWQHHYTYACEHDKEIAGLQQTINRLQTSLVRKNRVLARLDEQIYKERPKIVAGGMDIHSVDQIVSMENTVYYLEQELANKAGVITELREKYAELENLEQHIKKEQSKQHEKLRIMEEANALLTEKIQELQGRKQGESSTQSDWKTKFEHQRYLRQDGDRKMVELLLENQALHYLAQENMGPTFKQRMDDLVKELQQKKGHLESNSDFKYSTIQELLNQNRLLMAEVRRLRSD